MQNYNSLHGFGGYYTQPTSLYRDILNFIDLDGFSHEYMYSITINGIKLFEEIIIYLATEFGYEDRHFMRPFGNTYVLYIAFDNEEAATLFLLKFDGLDDVIVDKVEKE